MSQSQSQDIEGSKISKVMVLMTFGLEPFRNLCSHSGPNSKEVVSRYWDQSTLRSIKVFTGAPRRVTFVVEVS